MKKKKFCLYVSFPLEQNWRTMEEDLRARIATHKPILVASGAGFGMRDLEFELKANDKYKAEEIAKDVVLFFQERKINNSEVSIKQ